MELASSDLFKRKKKRLKLIRIENRDEMKKKQKKNFILPKIPFKFEFGMSVCATVFV